MIKAVVLSELLLNTLDDLDISDQEVFPSFLKQLVEYLEKAIDAGYHHKSIRGSNQFQELIHKVDTVIRKNSK